MNQDQPSKAKRGFASMDPEKQREIASKGGKAVPAGKRSFSQNSDLAAAAGRKGGISVNPANRSFSKTVRLHQTQEEKAVMPRMPGGGLHLRSPNHDALLRCELMGISEHTHIDLARREVRGQPGFLSRFSS